LSTGAKAANTNLLPAKSLVLARYTYDPWWTLAATPTTGQTGTTTITLTATNDAGLSTAWQVLTTVSPPVPLGGGPLSNWTNLIWETAANAPWFVQTNITHNGLPAAQSGAIGDGQETWLQTTVFGPGTLTYWRKVSSETGFDLLEFYVDGLRLTNFFISGEVDWQQQIVSVPSGGQTIVWEYAKDESGSSGLDAGWVSGVTFVFTGLWLEPTGPPANGQLHLVLHGSPGSNYEIESASNLVSWSTLATISIPPTNTSGAVPYTDAVPTDSPWRFYRARQQ
jgi:hypothetical protein